jgi:hypothetical protein
MSLTPNSALPDLQQTVVDLQRQLAGALTERDEALARETATSEVLQVINSSPGDLGPVFDAMLEKATRLCEGVQGVLWTIDGERLRLAASYQLAAGFIEWLHQIERGELEETPGLKQDNAGRTTCACS